MSHPYKNMSKGGKPTAKARYADGGPVYKEQARYGGSESLSEPAEKFDEGQNAVEYWARRKEDSKPPAGATGDIINKGRDVGAPWQRSFTKD